MTWEIGMTLAGVMGWLLVAGFALSLCTAAKRADAELERLRRERGR